MFDIHEELKKLPDKPGVYIMRDSNDDIIYIGKAVVLKNRVRQYFHSLSNQLPKVQAMVPKIKRFEYIVTDSELEALILECNLIKKHRPKFNILLKDDKGYPYIKVTMNEEFPRIISTRKYEKDGAKYFGPYTSGFAVKETIALIKELFPIKSCNKALAEEHKKQRPCLNYYIHKCLGPCQGDVNKQEYRNLMKDICSFLGGKHEEMIKRLEIEMAAASENMEFEKAADLRDKITSLRHVAQKQKVVTNEQSNQDVVGFSNDSTDSCVEVFFIRCGKLLGREHFVFEGMGESSESELMTSFVKQFYANAAYIPEEIIIQTGMEEIDIIEEWLTAKKGGNVRIRVPQRGEKLKLVQMASQNAIIALRQFKEDVMNKDMLAREGIAKLKDLLGLDDLPSRIEAYDISNTGNTEIVASMVVFEKGHSEKKEYRRFKVKSIDSQNDYGSMQEVIYRRFEHAKREKQDVQGEAKFSKLPDLILADGGLGHVNSVLDVLSELNIVIPVAGMVKDDHHRTRGLVTRDNQFDLSSDLNLLRFITAIQDEAHRFAIEYNRKLVQKRYKGSELDEIEGVGPKKKKALIKHFGSLKHIKQAQVDELFAVDGINLALAKKIFEYFNGGSSV